MRARLIFVGLLSLAGTGCNFWYNEVPSPDDLMHAVPWFDHMILSKAVHPYQRSDIPRTTPAGIVPIGGAEADWGTGNPLAKPVPTYGFDQAYANALQRPTDLPPVAPERGQVLYDRFCATCHGQTGAGGMGGAVGPVAPTLLGARVAGFTDGYLYSYIKYGGTLMPKYGDKITQPEDRWAVVDYVRSLNAGGQSAGGQP